MLSFTFCNGQISKKIERDSNTTTIVIDSNYNKLKTYLLKLSDTLHLDNFDAIIFLSEIGCPSCNKNFSNAIAKYLINKSNVLIILNAKGYQINTKPFLSNQLTNVVPDYGNDFYHLHLFFGSGIILFKDNQIEKIIEIKLENIEKTIHLVEQIGNDTNYKIGRAHV